MPGLSEVSRCPDGRPRSGNVAEIRQGHRDPNSEAKLTPATHHRFCLRNPNRDLGLLRESDLHGPILRDDDCGVTPPRVARSAVVQVDGFPEWIAVGVERSTVVVEFAGEDQVEFRPCRSPIWSFLVVALVS